MGFFSSKKKVAAPPLPTSPQPLPQLVEVSPQRYASAKEFMTEWATIIGQASDSVFWDALARFGRIVDATQAENNSQSANMRFLGVAKNRFNNDFKAFLDWPWRNWLEIAKKANRTGDFDLPVQIFFFAWAIQNQVTFSLDISMQVGFQDPTNDTFKDIAAEAFAAASAAGDDFAVLERSTQPPVPKAAILEGTGQVIGP